jgi:hypothetical protein
MRSLHSDFGKLVYNQKSDTSRAVATALFDSFFVPPTVQPMSNMWSNSPLAGFGNDATFGSWATIYNGAQQ